MIKTVKAELTVSQEHEAILQSQSRIANALYNKLVEQVLSEKQYYRDNKKQFNFNIFSAYDIRNLVPKLKEQRNLYKTLFSSVAKNVAFRLSDGINLWKKAVKDKSRFVGFPKYRSIKKKGFFSLTYEDPFVGYKIENNNLKLSLGQSLVNGKLKHNHILIPFKKQLKIDASKIKVLTIHQDKHTKQYVAIFTLETTEIHKKNISRIISLDPNHKNLAVGYDHAGNTYEFANLYSVKILDKRIEDIKKKRNKCVKQSRRWNYLDRKILEIYRVRREQIQVYLRTISNYLCKQYDLIGIGNYVPFVQQFKQMNRAMINQSCLGQFRTETSHICERSGKTYVKFDENNTTKTCSKCLTVGEKLSPAIREWTCKECSTFHIRDENAAQNGFRIILEQRQLPCSGYLPVKDRYICRFNGSSLEIKFKKQEIKNTNANSISKS